MNAIKSVIKNSPSVCASGIKISKRLCSQLREHLKIKIDEDAEIDGIYFYPSEDKLNIMFGECKVIITYKVHYIAPVKLKYLVDFLKMEGGKLSLLFKFTHLY